MNENEKERNLAVMFFRMLDKSNQYVYDMNLATPKQLDLTIDDVLNSTEKMKNIFFAVNDFEIVGNNNYILRKKDKVFRFNAFYFDIDFKNEKGEHFQDDSIVNAKKKEVYSKLMKLKIRPSVIESKNGYHIYFILKRKGRTQIKAEEWQNQEDIIFEYIKQNISDGVDVLAKNITRILRVPETYHYKSDSIEPFKVTVKSLASTHTLDEICEAFPPVDYEQQGEKKAPISNRQRNNTTNKDLQRNNLVNAIKNLDASYFDYVEKVGIHMRWFYAVEFIRHYDIRKFFNLNVKFNECFRSLFREDNNPSCTIYHNKQEKKYLYHDFADAEFQSVDLFQIVQNIAGVDFNTSVEFLCDVFQISLIRQKNGLVKDIDSIIANNINVFEKVADSDKKLKYMKNIIDVYQVILQIWKERQDKANFNNPLDLKLSLGQEFLSKRAGVESTKLSRILLILEGLRALKKIKGKAIKSFLPVNTYLLNELDEVALKSQAIDLKQYIKKMSQITRPKLKEFLSSQTKSYI